MPRAWLLDCSCRRPWIRAVKRRVRGADLRAHGFQLALDEALTLRGRVAAKDHSEVESPRRTTSAPPSIKMVWLVIWPFVSPPAFRAPTCARCSPARAAVRVARRQGGNNGLVQRTPQLTYTAPTFKIMMHAVASAIPAFFIVAARVRAKQHTIRFWSGDQGW